LLRVKGESMVDAAILDGDLVLVNPQKTANNGDIVVAQIEGIETEATVKTFFKEENRIRLQPQNKYMEPIYVDPNTQIDIVGKVSAVIRKL
jgi:repressor LexA